MALIEMITPVTDRTLTDVERVKELFNKGYQYMSASERAEWLGGMKGALNKSDLERIENNIQLLSDVLELDLDTCYGDIPNIPTTEYFSNLLDNVEAIRNGYAIYDTTPLTPVKMNTYTEVNAVEQILFDVYTILRSNFYNYTGELYAGEVLGLPI